jgi:phage gp46-like protein
MSQNLMIDPTKRDYVFQNGSPIPSDRVLEKCYYALLIPENAWVYGQPGQGSLLYTLQNAKRTGNIEKQFSDYASAAIKTQVIDTGDATASEIQNIASSRTGTSNQIEVIPSQVQLSQQLNFVPV